MLKIFWLTFVLFWPVSSVWAVPLRIVTSTPPHAFVTNEIGGAFVKVQALIDNGQDPHTFTPTPKQIMNLDQAAILFTTGLPFERPLVRQIKDRNKQLLIVDLTKGVPTHNDEDGDLDPHIWLSPPLLKIQAATIAETLSGADPAHAEVYKRNLAGFITALQKVDQRIRTMLRPFAGRSFYVFHPAFSYFGAAYGLHQKAVEVGGGSPSPRQLAQLIQRAKADKVRIIFTQPQFDQRSAAVVAAAINGTVMSLDPMAYDVLKNFTKIARALEEALK